MTPATTPAPRLAAPYADRQVWAVAPFLNESGVSRADGLTTAEVFAREAQDIRGVDVIPVPRTRFVMLEEQIFAIGSQADAERLMNVLDVDGLVVGTITAYDPYPPLVLGLSVTLFQRDDEPYVLDVRDLARAPRDGTLPDPALSRAPASEATRIFDGRDEVVIAEREMFAVTHTPPDTAYGTEIFTVSMPLFTQFASHRLLFDLLRQEQTRLSRETPQTSP